jgi:hypothetical protein
MLLLTSNVCSVAANNNSRTQSFLRIPMVLWIGDWTRRMHVCQGTTSNVLTPAGCQQQRANHQLQTAHQVYLATARCKAVLTQHNSSCKHLHTMDLQSNTPALAEMQPNQTSRTPPQHTTQAHRLPTQYDQHQECGLLSGLLGTTMQPCARPTIRYKHKGSGYSAASTKRTACTSHGAQSAQRATCSSAVALLHNSCT